MATLRSTASTPSGSFFVRAAIVSLSLKAPLVVVGVLNPVGVPGAIPPTAIDAGLFLTLAFLASGIVFLARRHWFGVVSTAAYCMYSLVGGFMLAPSYLLWAGAIIATSTGALIFTAFALRSKAFIRQSSRNL